MSDGITKWLEQLGLSEFDELFAEQKVVYDDLRDLTDTDLKDLGVPLGPRKRLLRAISQLQTDRESTDVAGNRLSQQHPRRKKLNVAS